MTNQRRLGRGLEALLSRPLNAPETGPGSSPALTELRVADIVDAVEAIEVTGPDDGLAQIPVELIDSNPFQPRVDFDEQSLAELAASLAEHGMLQPLVVRRHGERYQLIAGERRLRAAIKAGWTTAAAQIRAADDREMAELAIVENLQRRDLNPLEKAASFSQYLERYKVTQSELAGRLKIDRSTIANLIRLLDLPDTVQQSLRAGAISQGHARALLPLGSDGQQTALCQRIEREQLSVRAVEDLVQEMIRDEDEGTLDPDGTPAAESRGTAAPGGTGLSAPGASSATGGAGGASPSGAAGANPAARGGVSTKGAKPARARSGHLAQLEQEFRSCLGAKVSIRQTAQGRGKIVIPFASHEEFERLRDLLCGPEVEVR